MAKANEYRHIAAWGRMMSSDRSYIFDQQVKAAADNAPIDAVYFGDGQWRRFSEVTNEDTITLINRFIGESK
jgi:hypothetical protein